MNERYRQVYIDDCLYWYNERATVGSLAGAIWRTGGFAVEEYREPKKRKGKHYMGRTDLWFSLGENNRKCYVVEAKQK